MVLVFAGLIPKSVQGQETLPQTLERVTDGVVSAQATGQNTASQSPEPVTATESLWDVLARADLLPLNLQQVNIIAPATVRRPLGPVPGLTLPAPRRAREEQEALLGRNRRARGVIGDVSSWFERLKETTGTKIKVTGYNTLSFRSEQISGNADAFRSDQYFGRGSNGFYADTDLTIEATFFKHFRYETRITNSPFNNPFDPNNNRIRLDYNTERLKVEWGNINAGFQGNSLIDFNRFLHGFQIRNTWSRQFQTSVLYSQTRAETRTITIPGNNSAGPYFVFAGQIVEGSDRVRVNDRELVKGRDYTLDIYTGELNFLGGRIVLATDAIAVTFETVGFNQQRGNIYGIRAEYTPQSATRFGLTYVTQQARGSGAPQSRVQQFYGYGAPGAAYLLDAPADITRPVRVTVAGVPLVQGVDYVLDATLNNQIRIAQAVPTNVIVQVEYFPLNLTPVPGNRSVLGLDGRISLGRIGNITSEFALSGLSINDNNVHGQAMQVRADLTPLRNLNTSLTFRHINPTFSSIQSPGFNRNERSMEFNADYTPSANLRLNLSLLRSRRPAYAGMGAGQFTINTLGEDDYTQSGFSISNNFGFNLLRRRAPGEDENAGQQQNRMQKGRIAGSVSFSRNSLGTRFAAGGSTANTSDSLALNLSFRSLSLTASLLRNENRAESLFELGSGGAQQFTTRSTTLGKQINLSWNPYTWLQLTGSLSENDIQTLTGSQNSQTTARNTQFTASINPLRDVRIRYTYQLSDTGNLANLITPPVAGGIVDNPAPTGSGGGNIIGPTRGMPPGILWRTRQAPITAGGASSALHSGFQATPVNTVGGGNFANLGGFGNYSGFYGSNFNNGYGVSSFGGRSASNNLGLDWTLRSSMTLGVQYTSASSIGDYQYNSDRNALNFTFNWQPSDRLQLSLVQGFQKIAYQGGFGGSDTTNTSVNLSGRPFGGKLGLQMSFMSLRTRSNLNFGLLDPGNNTGAPPDTSMTLNSISARVDYPLSDRYVLFAEWLNSTSAGYLGSAENNLRFGLDYRLMRNLTCSFGWQIFSRAYADPQYAQYNYRVSTLLAEIGLRF